MRTKRNSQKPCSKNTLSAIGNHAQPQPPNVLEAYKAKRWPEGRIPGGKGYPGEAPMTTLGNALYVIGCVAAVPLLAFAIYSAATLAGYFGGTTAPFETQIFAERMTASAVVSWLGGRLARHILAGT